jgi:hypothetical protein
MIKLLKQAKLEFTLESDYILQYYDYKNFIIQEQENTNIPNTNNPNNDQKPQQNVNRSNNNQNQQQNTNNRINNNPNNNQNQQQNVNNQTPNNQETNEQHTQKMEVLIYVVQDNAVNKVETAELELNVVKPVKIEITLYAKTPQEATDVITSLSTLLKREFIDKLIISQANVELIKISIRKNKIISYALYDKNNQLLEQKNFNIDFKQAGVTLLVGSPILALVIWILYKSIILMLKVFAFIAAHPVFVAIGLFTIVLLILMNTEWGKNILARILGQARSASNKTEAFLKLNNIKLEAADVALTVPYLAVGFYVLTAGLAVLIYKMLGMPIMIAAIFYSIFIAINLHSIHWDIGNLMVSIKYILTHFNEAFTTVYAAGTPLLMAKTGVVIIFAFVVFTVLKKIFSKRQPVNPPDQDKMLAEIQTKFR